MMNLQHKKLMSKKSLIITLLIFCFIFLGGYLSIEPVYTPTAIPSSSKHTFFPTYIAHKSIVSNKTIGNTTKAIQEALSSYVDGIEVDVRLSKDGVLFLYHGDTLEESTNGYGKPEDHTWEQLHQLRYKDKYSKLTTLEEMFYLVGSQKFIFLDVKSDSIFNAEISDKLISLIHNHYLQETVIVESFNPFFLTSMRLKSRDILLMYDFTTNVTALGEEKQDQFNRIPWLLRQPFIQKQIRRIVKPDILGPRFNVEHTLIKDLIDKGYPIITWTVDNSARALELFQLGVKGIQSNHPIQLLEDASLQEHSVYDAGGTQTNPYEIVHVKEVQNVLDALDKAKKEQKKITIAGRRHSMGGQTLLNDSILLNMLGLDHVIYNSENKTVKVGAGATWKKVQNVLNSFGRSVKVMQSDNIFTIGGSVGVNVHGWQVGCAPLAATVTSMTVATADGALHFVNFDKEPELFRAVLGGYGLFGVVIEVELETVSNSNLTFHVQYMHPKNFLKAFENNITNNSKTELAYARLSVDKANLFNEVGLFWYENTGTCAFDQINSESLVFLKRGLLRYSELTDNGKKLRWMAEKLFTKMQTLSGAISRNNAMNTDIHVLWPLYGKSKDILHEYFVPKNQFLLFINALKNNILAYDVNVLNVTVREVLKDNISLLPYAKEDMFAFVCLFPQKQDVEEEEKMRAFTEKVVNEVLKLGGTFYLPYRLHYSRRQLSTAYPEIKKWQELKTKWDPDHLFDSEFYQHIKF